MGLGLGGVSLTSLNLSFLLHKNVREQAVQPRKHCANTIALFTVITKVKTIQRLPFETS